VMPLVNNSKYGISYIYQPFFTQQLGVFSNLSIESAIVGQFLNAIPKHFRLTDMNLNLGNAILSEHFSTRPNTTYHLSLQSEISEIQAAYNSNTRRNIQKATQNKVTISQISDVPLFLKFTSENLKEKSQEIKSRHYLALQEAINYALKNKLGEIYVACNSKNKMLASVFFVRSNQTSIYLAASSNQEGIEKSAMFLLIDTFIQNHAKNNLTLDFEGSNISGIARFYAGFGGLPKTYFSVHQNRLPKLLRIFKK
jgi:lipid II:glycine glycyltransferase (peptidoglycan interpeptide bridge formation enzyme)